MSGQTKENKKEQVFWKIAGSVNEESGGRNQWNQKNVPSILSTSESASETQENIASQKVKKKLLW